MVAKEMKFVHIENSWNNIALYLQGIKYLSEYIIKKTTGRTEEDYYNDLDFRFLMQFALGKIGDFIITIRDISGELFSERTDITEQKRKMLFLERYDFHWTAFSRMRSYMHHSYFRINNDVLLETIKNIPEELIKAVDVLSQEPEVSEYLARAQREASNLCGPIPIIVEKGEGKLIR